MVRFSMLLLWLGSGLYAASLTSVSCTLGSVTQMQSSPTSSSCGLYDIIPQPPSGVLEIGVTADARAMYDSVSVFGGVLRGTPGPVSYSTTATLERWFDTAGPKRTGLIDFNLVVPFGHGCCATALLTDGIHEYGPNAGEPRPPMPIELGTPFHFALSASAQFSCVGADCFSRGQDLQAYFALSRLLEADGTTPVNYVEIPSPIPEPTVSGLLLLGGLTMLLAVGIRQRRKVKPRRRSYGRAGSDGSCNGPLCSS